MPPWGQAGGSGGSVSVVLNTPAAQQLSVFRELRSEPSLGLPEAYLRNFRDCHFLKSRLL